MLRPIAHSLSVEERQSYAIATYHDPYDAAAAAADSEIADRLAALELLRDLANRYRVAGRERALDTVEIALIEDRGLRTRVVSAQLQAPRASPAGLRSVTPRKVEADSYSALTQSFTENSGFGALVHSCIDTVRASGDKPTYNPKLFDWLCRASILPEAATRLAGDGDLDSEKMTALALGLSRLLSLADRCKASISLGCGDIDKLLAQLINQQPVTRVPEYLDKISVERTAMPAAAALPPPTQLMPATQMAPTTHLTPAAARRPTEHHEGSNLER
jgi:hypothetical protein